MGDKKEIKPYSNADISISKVDARITEQ